MIPRRLLAALSWLLLAGVFTGCRNRSSTVAVIPRTTATLLWEPMHLGAAEEAHRRGMHIYWNAPADEGDVEQQLAEFSTCVERHYSGIVFAPDETLASRSIVLDAVRRKIPVVVVDDQLGPPAGPALSYVSSDEAAGAQMAAERVSQILHGQGTIAVIGINSRSENGIFREEKFEKLLAQIAPSIQIANRSFGDPIVGHQQQIAQELLEEQKVNAIVAMTREATRGAYFAKLADHFHSDVPIVGFDQDMLIPVQSGEVDSVIMQNTRKIGELAITNLEAEIHGGRVAPVTLVPPLLLTRETADDPEIKHLWEFTQYDWERQ
jgi:ribose transport system substrate-binding protein